MSQLTSKLELFVPRALTLACTATVIVTLVVSTVSTFSLEYFESNVAFVYLLNAVSIVVLTCVIVFYVHGFWKQFRRGVAGTQMAIRFLRIFAVVTLLSLSFVYCFTFFSIRGLISGWVEQQVSATVAEASQLSELFVESIKDKVVLDLRDDVAQLEKTDNPGEITSILFNARSAGDYEEITYFVDPGSPTGIVATSAKPTRVLSLAPINPTGRLIEEIVSSENKLDKVPVGEIFNYPEEGPMLRLLVPVLKNDQKLYHYVQVVMKLSQSSVRLAEEIRSLNSRYERLVFLRKPIQINFVLTLTLVTLVVLLLATWAAIKLTSRLVQPIQALSEGTRKVAAGDYDQSLPVTTNDDLGVLIESFNDMTQKIKTSQEEIEEQRSYLEIVLQDLTSGVFFVDQDLSVTSINLAAESILDISENQFTDHVLDDLIADNHKLAPLLTPLRDGIVAGKDRWKDTVELKTRQGVQVVTYSTTRISTELTGHTSYVVVVEDITNLISAQRVEAWRQVAKRASHEILNPLQPIRLAVDRIRLKTTRKLSTQDSESLSLSFSAIDRQLDAMTRIVKGLRDYENLTSTTFPERINLNKLIDEVSLLHAGGDKQMDIVKHLDEHLPDVYADPEQLTQVFNNILINTKDAGRETENLMLAIETKYIEPDEIALRFADNGPGFSPQMLEKAFEPFETSKQDKGKGLGLSIVKKIVDAHGAQITAVNRPEGGAEISIRFNTGTV